MCRWKDCRTGQWCDPSDHFTYFAVMAQPQYFRAAFYIDQYHDGWQYELSVSETIRHELAHVLLSRLSQEAFQCTSDTKKHANLHDAEDAVVERIARMPCWAKLEP